jgi:adenosylhomocysteine nucleosidase
VERLIGIPIQDEIDSFLQGCTDSGFSVQGARLGRLRVVQLPEQGITVACGGLSKVQFALQTQHLLDVYPDWDVVICAGAAGRENEE